MRGRALITGGAGFIGSHLADELIRSGYRVRVFDCLASQVHGPAPGRPSYLDPRVELCVGDVRERGALANALDGVDFVFHFAAAVGVGQSMYEISRYTSINNLGTATLLEECAEREIERLVVASSMSIYGEGLYRNAAGEVCVAADRSPDQLRAGQWEPRSADGSALTPIPTPESKPPSLASVYALSKFDQERMCLMLGRAYGLPAVALRFFNTYGPRQALSNPYTGVLAIFASRLLNGNPPIIFEDGLQQRDFVHVRDVARACRLALESEDAPGAAFNIGSGRAISVLEVAQKIAKVLGASRVRPEITHKYRVGDVRHCFADISRARQVLGYEPSTSFSDGLRELARWLRGQMPRDRVVEAKAELEARGLTV